MLKVFSQQVTKLELELVQTKQEMGDALNQVHELEMYHNQQAGNRPPPLRASKIKKPKGSAIEYERGSEESDGGDASQNDMGMFYEADAGKDDRGSESSIRDSDKEKRDGSNKFNMPNLFKSLKTKMEQKK